jgi:hypothetical protein
MAAVFSHAEPAHAELSIMEFSANGLYATQAAGGNSYTGQAAWNPTIGLGGVDLRGNLGISYLKSSFDSHFAAFNYQAFLKLGVLPTISVEGGGGLETWVSNGGTHPILSGDVNFEFPFKLLGVIDRIFAGYSRFFLTGNGTNEFRLGVGFTI